MKVSPESTHLSCSKLKQKQQNQLSVGSEIGKRVATWRNKGKASVARAQCLKAVMAEMRLERPLRQTEERAKVEDFILSVLGTIDDFKTDQILIFKR